MKPGFLFIYKKNTYIYIYKRERERERALWPPEKRRSDRVGICNKVQGLAKTFSYFLGMELFFYLFRERERGRERRRIWPPQRRSGRMATLDGRKGAIKQSPLT